MLVSSVLHLAVDVPLAKLLFPVGLQGQAGLFRPFVWPAGWVCGAERPFKPSFCFLNR